MPQMQLDVGNDIKNKLAPGSQNAAAGYQGDQYISPVHGKWYNASLAGNLFMGGTVIAGVALPVAAATLNAKFTLHNPASSTKNIELVRFSMGVDSATIVVNQIGCLIQRNISTSSGIPTTVTNGTTFQLGPAGGLNASFGQVYTQATLTNVAIPGVTAATAVPIPFYGMFSMEATATTSIDDLSHDFDGRIILAPDSLVSFCTSVAAATAGPMNVIWAEWAA